MQAYDSHCNLILGDVEEIVYMVDEDEESDEVRTVKKQSEMLFVRGMAEAHLGLGDLELSDLTTVQETRSYSSRLSNSEGFAHT